ncbi:MAG: chemotaxis protein CheA [Lachnospiraceae bacterium]|nr:chemotaxis protein CheA [Eubacteriales bacterium]MDY2607219.1 chemotaxis protein CheA [Lachnospiraceae bacterium]
MDVSQYLEIFIDETNEHLQSLNEQLLIIEKEPENTDTINEIFRAAHSLKGMAGTMGYKRMQKLTHQMENVFSEIRNGKMKVTPNLVDVLFQCLDALESYLEIIQESGDEGDNDNEAILNQLDAILNGGAPQADKKEEVAQAAPEKKADDGKKEKYKDFVFADFEKHAIEEAFEKKMNVYTITVFVDESCLLKAARAFLVFKNLEGVGEIIKSNPPAQDIEDEKFDFDFSICVISSESLEKVLGVIKNVSEIKDAIGEKLEKLPEEKKNETAVAEKKEEKKETKAPAKGGSNKPAAGKPIVNRSVRVDIEKLDVLMNLVSELIIAKNGLVSQSVSDASVKSQAFNEQIEYLERVTTNLHESVMKVRMMPIETVTQKFPRMIRDLCKKLNKNMKLVMTGEDTELDRTVIDEIGDPLMHLLRNSADHGLESPEKRAERGKPEVGIIRLDAYQDGNNVVIEVGDDGNGIDVEAVRNKAVEKGTVTPEQAELMSDKEVIDLLFKPSFSTAKVVSDISGRGVGLDVVKTKIESLGGDIEVKTALGEGSTFVIRLPLTLAIIQALMVELGDEKYAISLGSIQTIEDIPVSEIKYVQTKEVVNLRGTVIPLIRLDSFLDIEHTQDDEILTVVVVNKGDKLAGLVVDKLIGQQEIVIKSLGKYISNSSKIIGGATILGDGEVALILDVNTLL